MSQVTYEVTLTCFKNPSEALILIRCLKLFDRSFLMSFVDLWWCYVFVSQMFNELICGDCLGDLIRQLFWSPTVVFLSVGIQKMLSSSRPVRSVEMLKLLK